jgi:hypothetical protein
VIYEGMKILSAILILSRPAPCTALRQQIGPDTNPLPDAIVAEIKRVADRVEIRFEETTTQELPAAGRKPDLPVRRATPALAAVLCDPLSPAPGDLRQGATTACRRGRGGQDDYLNNHKLFAGVEFFYCSHSYM